MEPRRKIVGEYVPNNSGFGAKFKAGRRPESIGETGKP